VAKKKVAVLGGGVGAMTTAFYLSSFKGWRDRYDLTVYQLGWRLGGKGASGRNMDAHARVEEHGLHMFFGFYDNAFATMQRLYGELGRHPSQPLASWHDAWKPQRYFVLEEQVGGETVPWEFDFPSNDGVPGQGGELPHPWEILQLVLGWAKELFEKASTSPDHTSATEEELDQTVTTAADRLGATSSVEQALRFAVHAITDAVAHGPQILVESTFLHAAAHHAKKLSSDPSLHAAVERDTMLFLLRGFIKWLKGHWAADALRATPVRRALILIDLAIAAAVGMIVDDLIIPPVDWFKIDGVRLEDWLMKHGADRASVESPPVLLLSEVVFARWAGVGAGTCLHYAIRLAIGYKGAFAYEMQAGMGDTIFAPFYEVLRRRGVRFEFFQCVEELATGTDASGKRVIDAITIGTQATVKGGDQGAYQPFVDVKGLPCWPSEPLYDQLVEGAALKASGENLENWWTRWPVVSTRTLKRGVDFDEVVLGISIGAYPYICKQLIVETPAFAEMVSQVKVTQTQAAQLWLRPDYDIMGWPCGPQPVIGTYFEPFDTLCDMSHLIPREDWPAGTLGNITYLTSQLPDDAGPATPPRSDWQYPLAQRDRVWRNVNDWLDTRVGGLFPYALDTNTGSLNWDLLAGAAGTGRDRLKSQYWVGCWNPSDRYVMSVPGSSQYRLPSAGTGYHNLVMAGDWTLNAIAAGCVESAVMSGMHAARAMCGHPEVIVGDNLPDGSDLPPVPPPDPPRPRGRYIDIDGNNTPLQPYAAQGVTMYNFVLEADMDRLQAICDQQLNLGPITYRPLGPFVCFVAATMGPMAPVSPRAWLDEKDFGFWIPVVAGRQDAAGFEALRPAFFIPYLWVDDYLPQQAGREVFGYPKGVGKLVNPVSPGDPSQFTLDALVVPELGPPGNPASRWQWKRLVTASRRGGDPWQDLVREFDSILSLGGAIVKAMVDAFAHHTFPAPTLALLINLFKDAAELDVPMVYLKQFRDVADGANACYQAIVESPNRLTALDGAGFLPGDWELAIDQFATVSLIDKLGLKCTSPGVATAAFHFWVQMAFTAAPGEVVYRAV
jgi:uncharacterized protein with NAD-binding domain and iron-sulfur cluster